MNVQPPTLIAFFMRVHEEPLRNQSRSPEDFTFSTPRDDRLDRAGYIVREGFDVAVWGGALDDSSLVARKLGSVAGGYFASPRYLARRPAPKSPDQLGSHELVTITKGYGTTEWAFWMGGKPKRVAIRPRLVVDDAELAARAAAAGLGIAPAPMAIAERYLEKKTLVAVLSKWTPPPVDVYAVLPPGGALVPKTRALVDVLATCFTRSRSGTSFVGS